MKKYTLIISMSLLTLTGFAQQQPKRIESTQIGKKIRIDGSWSSLANNISILPNGKRATPKQLDSAVKTWNNGFSMRREKLGKDSGLLQW